jgi:hypothetical protein
MQEEILVDGVRFYPIPGYVGYAVSKCGKVRSLPRSKLRSNGSRHKLEGRLLKPGFDKDGYPQVSLRPLNAEGQKMRKIHRLMGLTFLGVKEGQQIDHRNREKSDNNLDNLRVVNGSENQHNRITTKGYLEVNGKFYARIRVNGKQVNLGGFATPGEAHQRYVDEKNSLSLLHPESTAQYHRLRLT